MTTENQIWLMITIGIVISCLLIYGIIKLVRYEKALKHELAFEAYVEGELDLYDEVNISIIKGQRTVKYDYFSLGIANLKEASPQLSRISFGMNYEECIQ